MKHNSILPQVINRNDTVVIVFLYIYGYELSVLLQEL